MRCAFVIMDGLGGIPGKSALKIAKKKNLDRMAKKGVQGMFYSLGKGVIPGSDTAHLSIFGYGLEDYPGRGPIEALGAGIKLKSGDVALRVNLATAKDGIVVDRRAGRISTQEAKKIEKLIGKREVGGFEFLFKATVQHRGVLVIRGGASDKVSDTDPHKDGEKELKCRATSKEARATAEAINSYIRIVKKLLKGKRANTLLLRGAGKLKKVESFSKKHGIRATLVAGGAMYKGVAKFVGIEAPEVKGATGTEKTDLSAKARAAVKSRADVCFIHVKATDNFGHDGKLSKKAWMIERVDKEMMPVLEQGFDVVVVTGDHATPCKLKRHSSHGAPILCYGESTGTDSTKAFEEVEASKGFLGHISGGEPLEMVKDWIGKGKKTGS